MSEKLTRNCMGWLWIGLLALAILGLLMNYFGKNSAEQLRSRALEAVNTNINVANNYQFANIKIDNATMILTGVAPSLEAKNGACDTAKKTLISYKMYGLPGIVANIDCNITIEGEAQAIANTAPLGNKAPTANSVSNNECQSEINAIASSAKVAFAKSGSNITGGTEMLDKIAASLAKCADVKLEVGGHTDTGGDEAMNLRLSQSRAEAVRKYIISKGGKPENITAKGYGETKPLVADNAVIGVDSPLREKNRRTEFIILGSN